MASLLFDLNDLISLAEAARLRGVSRQAMSRLAAKGRFREVTIGGREFVSRKEIESYVPLKAGRPMGSISHRAEESGAYQSAPFPVSKVAEGPGKKYGQQDHPPAKKKR